MIDTIEVIIQNGALLSEHFVLKCDELKAYLAFDTVNISKEFLDNLVSTIRSWKNEYGSDSKIDSEEFTVIVTSNDKTIDKFHGKGIYPDNYSYFIELLGEIK